MTNKAYLVDKNFIKKCIDLSKLSLKNGDAPFGSLVTKNNKIVAKSTNSASDRTSDHAEILALHFAAQKLKTTDLSDCVLYSNCEPYPMCSFMAREYKVKKVVFALPSPYVGGFSKWGILQDTEIEMFAPFF